MRLELKRDGDALPWNGCCLRRRQCRTLASSCLGWDLGLRTSRWVCWSLGVEEVEEEGFEESSSRCLHGEDHMPWWVGVQVINYCPFTFLLVSQSVCIGFGID